MPPWPTPKYACSNHSMASAGCCLKAQDLAGPERLLGHVATPGLHPNNCCETARSSTFEVRQQVDVLYMLLTIAEEQV